MRWVPPLFHGRGTTLYQKFGPNGEHLKFGITKKTKIRYKKKQLGGGNIKVQVAGAASQKNN